MNGLFCLKFYVFLKNEEGSKISENYGKLDIQVFCYVVEVLL